MAGGEATTLGDVYALGKLLAALIPEPDDELTAIVRRAAADAPEDRFATVDALAADIQNYRALRPVAAMGRERRYLWRKFFARNRGPVLAAAGALALLVLAFAGTLWALERATSARRAEAARFEQVRALARYLLFDLNERLGRVAGNTGARADMANKAERYLAVLTASTDVNRPDLQLETAQGLIQLARIQGGTAEPNLGKPASAERNLVAAQHILAALDPAQPGVAAASVTARAVSGQILLNDEMRQDAAAREIEVARKIADRRPVGFEARRAVRRAEIDLADLGSDPAKLGVLADRLESDIGQWPAGLRSSRAAAFDRAFATYLRAQAESEGGARKDYGLPGFLAAERQFDALAKSDPNDPVTLLAMSIMFKDAFAAASRAGAEDAAQRLILKADVLSKRLIAIDDRDEGIRKRAGSIKEAIAQNLRDHDRFGEAIALQENVLTLRRANIGPDRNARRVADLGFSQMIMGVIARDAGQRALACASWTASEMTVGELEGRGQLAGFMKDFLPGLREKKRLCSQGARLDRLNAPMR